MRLQDLQIAGEQPQVQAPVFRGLAFTKVAPGCRLNNEAAANKVDGSTLACAVASTRDPGIVELEIGNMRTQQKIRLWGPESGNVDAEIRSRWGRPIGYINTSKRALPFCRRSRRSDSKKIQDQLVIIDTDVDGVEVSKVGNVKRENERLLSFSYPSAANLNSIGIVNCYATILEAFAYHFERAIVICYIQDPGQGFGPGLEFAIGIFDLHGDGDHVFGARGQAGGLADVAAALAIAQGQDPEGAEDCLLYTSPSPRDGLLSRMPSSA